MDDATLESLRAAFAATPDNLKLLAVIVRELEARGDVEALREALSGVPDTPPADAADRVVLARGLLRAGEPERALAMVPGAEPVELLQRARVLVVLGRQGAAAGAYEEAVRANATLEDLDLKAAIGAKVREIHRGGARLKVLSNDDTDTSELTRLLVPEPERVTFADVGGLDDVKKEITRRIILPFQKPSMFQRFKKRVGGGILMYGPPGCGKTLLARATAGECQATFFNVAISDVLDMYIGESERKLAALFEKARQSTPAVLFFDELEALAAKRQYTREGTSSKLVSQFLSEMDGFAQNNHGVLILGATNVPWAVDSAFRRPGRFDRVLFVPPPDRAARAAILTALLRERPVAGDLDVAGLAAAAKGFSGADLTQIVEAASDEAIEASLAAGTDQPIRREHLKAGLAATKPTTLDWLTTARNYARYANEAGHYDDVLKFIEKHGKG